MAIDQRLKDKNWRLENLYKIIDKNANLIKFRLNKVQRLFEEEKTQKNIILKARQLGFTTLACVTGLDEVIFSRNYKMIIIAHQQDAMSDIFSKVKIAWDNFPIKLKDYLGLKDVQDSANRLSFNNGSSIGVALSTRGGTVNRLHISEFGKMCRKFPHKALEVITGAFPSIPLGGRIDIESTAEGDFGYFHDMFWEAWDSGNKIPQQFNAFFYPWTLDEQYEVDAAIDLPVKMQEYAHKHRLNNKQANWYYLKKNELKDKMKQENPTTPEEAFESSGHKMFSMDSLEWQKQHLVNVEPVNGWQLFKRYKENHVYSIGADVAEGVGQDSSTAVIIDFTAKEIVGIYRNNKVAPDVFGHILAKMGETYGWCLIAPERNNHGHSTLSTLKNLYDNIYTEIKKDKTTDQDTKRLGWLTTKTSKPKMLFDINDLIKEEEFKIRSKHLYTELRTYDQEDLANVRFDEDQTKHWDLVMAFAIAWQMRTEVTSTATPLIRQVYDDFDMYDPI